MIVNHYAMPAGMKIWQYFAVSGSHFGIWGGFGLPLPRLLHKNGPTAGADATRRGILPAISTQISNIPGLIYAGIFYFKRKMSLQQVTDGNHYNGGNYLRKDGVNMYIFHQHFKQQVIDEQVGYKHKKIAKQLHPPPDGGIYKYHILV